MKEIQTKAGKRITNAIGKSYHNNALFYTAIICSYNIKMIRSYLSCKILMGTGKTGTSTSNYHRQINY